MNKRRRYKAKRRRTVAYWSERYNWPWRFVSPEGDMTFRTRWYLARRAARMRLEALGVIVA